MVTTRLAERRLLDALRADLEPLEERRCPLDALSRDEHDAQHLSYRDCNTRIVAELRALQDRIRAASWTPRSTEAAVARALRGRIDTDIEMLVQRA
jgi:hypothetical protein